MGKNRKERFLKIATNYLGENFNHEAGSVNDTIIPTLPRPDSNTRLTHRLLSFAGYAIFLFMTLITFALSLPGQETSILKKAQVAFRNQNYQEVIRLCEPYLNQHPEDVDLAFILAQAQAFSGNYEEALKVCNRILNQVPEHHDALVLKARVLIWSGRSDVARPILEALVKKNPDDIETCLELGRVEEISGQLNKAENIYLTILNRNLPPQLKAEVFVRLNRIYQKRGDLEKARAYLVQAIQLDPENKGYKKEMENLTEKRVGQGAVVDSKKAEIWVQYRSDDYSDQSNAFSSERLFFLYRPSFGLTIIPKLAHTRYFNRTDYQFGLEIYPKLWKNAYAYLDLNYATPANSLPRTSWLLEIYQHIYRGLEGSLGYWRMHFLATDVSVYIGSLGYYLKDYYFYLRGYYTPEEAGKNFSWVAQGRRYFGSENYFYLSFGSGSRPFEISNVGDLIFIKSTLFSAGFNFYLQSHWKLEGHFSLIKEKDGPRRTTVSLTAGYRF